MNNYYNKNITRVFCHNTLSVPDKVVRYARRDWPVTRCDALFKLGHFSRLLAAAVLLTQPLAQAQNTLEEVIVTAQKRSQNLQDVPISITALSEEAIDERNITSLTDIANQTPGLEFGEAAIGTSITIRGVGLSLVTGAGENSVAVHLDGVYLSRPGALSLSYEDLGGIEVLRGPQGTLYGRNATAGVLNLTTATPPEELEFGATLGAGNFDRERISAYLGGSVIDDVLRVRISAVNESRGDFVKNLNVDADDQGGTDLESYRLNADLTVSEQLELQLRALKADFDFNGPFFDVLEDRPGNILLNPGGFDTRPYFTRVNDAGDSNKALDLLSLKTLYDINDAWSFTSVTGYTKYTASLRGYDGDGTSTRVFTVNNEDLDEIFTQEVLFTYSGDSVQWVSGLYYLDQKYTIAVPLVIGAGDVLQSFNIDTSPFLGVGNDDINLNFDVSSIESTDGWAAFTDATWDLTDVSRVFAGIRFSQERKTLEQRQVISEPLSGITISVCGNNGGPALVEPLDTSTTTGRLGVQYDVSDESMVYGQVSRGFKAGGFSSASCNAPFDPEEIDAFEVGLKSTLLENTLRANASAFFYDYGNVQVEEVNSPFTIVNNAQAEVKGIELDVLYLPTPAWEFAANLSYLDATYTEFRNIDVTVQLINAIPGVGTEEDLAGLPLNRSPEWTLGASLQYTWEFDSAGRISARADATYKDDLKLREFDRAENVQESHTIYNAFLSYYSPSESFVIRGFVKNVTDEAVLAGLISAQGYVSASYNLPRTWGVDIDYRFGGN